MPAPATAVDRRAFLRAALTVTASAVAGAALAGCSNATPTPTGTSSQASGTTVTPASTQTASTPGLTGVAPTTRPSQAQTGSTVRGSNVLLAYFSRAGENYYYGGRRQLTVGNTQVVAEMISRLIQCDVYRIEAADPYSDRYNDTVARNVREQNADARPAIANPLPSVEQYDTILLGSPIWNVRAPMIMSTFVEGLDLTGKTVLPFTTYAMSGLGNAPRDYAQLLPTATIGDGLAVQGEKAASAETDVQQWLKSAGLR